MKASIIIASEALIRRENMTNYMTFADHVDVERQPETARRLSELWIGEVFSQRYHIVGTLGDPDEKLSNRLPWVVLVAPNDNPRRRLIVKGFDDNGGEDLVFLPRAPTSRWEMEDLTLQRSSGLSGVVRRVHSVRSRNQPTTRAYLMEEFYDGGNLDHWLQNNNTGMQDLQVREAGVAYRNQSGVDIVTAMWQLGTRGIVHLDPKPDNWYRYARGQWVIGDCDAIWARSRPGRMSRTMWRLLALCQQLFSDHGPLTLEEGT